MRIKIINRSRHPLPSYSTISSAGMDLRANLEKSVELLPQQRVMVPTGLIIELAEGYEGQIRPRSGLAVEHGITVLNTPGTIDADYRGEVKVILINLSEKPFTICDGDRIAQLVVAKFERVEWEEVADLSNSERGEKGFGSSGRK